MSHSSGDRELELAGQYIMGAAKGIWEFCRSMGYGFGELPKKKSRYIAFAVLTVLAALVIIFRSPLGSMIPEEHGRLRHILYAAPLIPVIFIYWLGEDRIRHMKSYEQKFEMMGFHAGKRKRAGMDGKVVEVLDYPKLIREERKGKQVILSFFTNIPVKAWKDRCIELETVFDCNIVKIEHAKTSKQVVRVHTIPTDQGLKDYIEWSDEYIREKDFELTLGVAMLEDVVFDLNKVPHALIAGVTGSGKSVIERCILWQCVKKGAKPYMIDFKGGVEFSKKYEAFGEVVTERDRVTQILRELVNENKERLILFRELDVKNLDEYNRCSDRRKPKGKEILCRIVLIADEVAEMLDTTGLSKEEKQVYKEIEGYLSTLARLARATGINLILATQRPDARVLPGQIKNNLPIRISGRMVDPQVSEMVLGSTKAAELGDIRGRFMYAVGADIVEFQAYKFDDRSLKEGEFTKGSMLTVDVEETETIPGHEEPENELCSPEEPDKETGELEDPDEDLDEEDVPDKEYTRKEDAQVDIGYAEALEADEEIDLCSLSSEEWDKYRKAIMKRGTIRR